MKLLPVCLGTAPSKHIYGTFHSHKNRKHIPHTLHDFKPGIVTTTRISQESSDGAEENALNLDDSEVELDSASPSNRNISKILPGIIEQNFAAALLKLEHFAHVPGTKVDEFLEEMQYLLCSAAFPLSVNTIEAVFQKHGSIPDKSVIKEVATALTTSHPLLKSIEKGGSLSTSYLRNKFYRYKT